MMYIIRSPSCLHVANAHWPYGKRLEEEPDHRVRHFLPLARVGS
jgi:hypothetical protein